MFLELPLVGIDVYSATVVSLCFPDPNVFVALAGESNCSKRHLVVAYHMELDAEPFTGEGTVLNSHSGIRIYLGQATSFPVHLIHSTIRGQHFAIQAVLVILLNRRWSVATQTSSQQNENHNDQRDSFLSYHLTPPILPKRIGYGYISDRLYDVDAFRPDPFRLPV